MANANKGFLGRRGMFSGGMSRNSARNSAGNSALDSRMSRGRFLRTAGIAGASIGAAAGLFGSGAAHAAGDSRHINVVSPSFIVVYPLPAEPNKPPIDIQNVQWAIDNVAPGGTVLLKATDKNGRINSFNFGKDVISKYEPVGVDIENKSITLCGEKISNQITTIFGGAAPFFVNKVLEEEASNQVVIIKDIKFEYSQYFSIVIYNLCDVTIEGCTILNPFSPLPNDTVMGILSHQAGKLTVKNCNISILASPPGNPPINSAVTLQGITYYGYYPWWFGGADLDIQGNIITIPYAAPTATYPDQELGPYPPYTGIVAAEPFVQYGIEMYGYDILSNAVITGNTITGESGILCCGMNGNSKIMGNAISGAKYYGIGLGWPMLGSTLDNATVTGNIIQMAGNLPQYGLESYGIWMLGASTVSGNTITGTYDYEFFDFNPTAP